VGLLAQGLASLPPAVAAATPSSGPGSHGRHAEPILAHLTDHLGSVIGSVNRDGVVVETRDYAPFGESIAQLGAFAVAQRFTGQPQDDAAGSLYNYGARFYAPRWGRFISPDEVVQSFDSQGLNPYSYVLNRPTSLVDPTGRFAGVSAPYGNTIALLGGCNPTYTTVRDPSSSRNDTEVKAVVWNTPLSDMRLADAGLQPVPMVLNLTRILLVDLHAFALGTFSQLVINPFMSVGKLLDRTLNGDPGGMREASAQLLKGTLVPRYALQNGPYWGRDQTSNDKLDSILEEAGFVHDGLCSPRCDSHADRTWIRIAWSDPWRLGPYGQAYRLAGTAAFSARIAWRSMTGQP
jgi:RHS repeat-associated protein